jgi:S-DNA-T family DNA segregation ATPase FtsK/SpoIIIE
VAVRIQTRALLGLLTDLARTADRRPDAGSTGAVLLVSGRGHHGIEPGRVELLAGMSTNHTAAAYAHTWCTGQLPGPLLWSLRDVQAVLDVFKGAAGRDPDGEHAVEILASADQVDVREDPSLLDDGVSLTFALQDLAPWPGPMVVRVLSGQTSAGTDLAGRLVVERDGRAVPPGPRLDVIPDRLDPFLRVGKRRRSPVQLYIDHPLLPVLVQVGDAYRGAMLPHDHGEYDADQAPDVDLQALPDVAAVWPRTEPTPAPPAPPEPALFDGPLRRDPFRRDTDPTT